MAIRRYDLGLFGEALPSDQDGFIATIDDGPFDLNVPHEMPTHDADGVLTPYGLWWLNVGWPDYQERVIAATAVAQAQLSEWRRRPSSRRK